MPNVVMLNLVLKSQNVQPLKLYKDGSNSSLETIRLGSSQVQKGKNNISGNCAQTISAVQAGNIQSIGPFAGVAVLPNKIIPSTFL
jgi:hypothetical protein